MRAACFLALLIALPSAGASLPLDRFAPSVDSSGFVRTFGARALPHLETELSLNLDFGWRPLVLRNASREVVASVVENRLSAHASVAVGLYDRVTLSLRAPLVLFQTAGDPAVVEALVGAPLAVTGVGDLALQAKVLVIDGDELGVAGLVEMTVPTALGAGRGGVVYGEHYLGAGPGAFQIAPTVAFSYTPRALVVHAHAGVRVRPSLRFSSPAGEVQLAPEFFASAGAGYDLEGLVPIKLTPFVEVTGALGDRFFPEDDSTVEGRALAQQVSLASALEWSAGARYRVTERWAVEGSIGTGVISGFGVADFRALMGLRYMPSTP